MQRVVARFNFSCTLIGNRPQSLTGHIVNRYGTKEVFSKIQRPFEFERKSQEMAG